MHQNANAHTITRMRAQASAVIATEHDSHPREALRSYGYSSSDCEIEDRWSESGVDRLTSTDQNMKISNLMHIELVTRGGMGAMVVLEATWRSPTIGSHRPHADPLPQSLVDDESHNGVGAQAQELLREAAVQAEQPLSARRFDQAVQR